MSVGKKFNFVKVTSPFKDGIVTLFEDDVISCKRASQICAVHSSRSEKFLSSNYPNELVYSNNDSYRGKGGQVAKNLCTLKGFELFMRENLKWTEDLVNAAMEQFEKNVTSTVPTKRTREDNVLEKILQQQQAFLKEARECIGREALYAATNSKEFQEKLDQAILKRVNAIEPEIRKSLQKKIRLEEEAQIREKVQADMDSLEHTLRKERTSEIFGKTLNAENFYQDDSKRVADLVKNKFRNLK